MLLPLSPKFKKQMKFLRIAWKGKSEEMIKIVFPEGELWKIMES